MTADKSRVPQVQPARIKRLLEDLVNIYSPSGKEEEIVEYAAALLKTRGFEVTLQEVDENRSNLLLLPENEDDIDLCYVGHLDTVSAYDLVDFEFYDEEDTIYGLGTADMKAGCAAMIEAFTTLAEHNSLPPSVALALVVGEEEDNSGARALVREYNFPWALVGEPTGLAACLGHYSYLEVALRTQGKRAHSSMPELGQNAIETMLKLLLRVTSYAAASQHGLVYNIRELSGFSGGFAVPHSCEAYLDIHLPPNSRIDVIKTELEKLVEMAGKEIPGLGASLRFEDTYPGYSISADRPLVQKLMAVFQKLSLPWEPQDFRSHSDANILWTSGVDSIILGPGRLESAHAPEESVPFGQVVQAAQLYLEFALAVQGG